LRCKDSESREQKQIYLHFAEAHPIFYKDSEIIRPLIKI